MILLQKAQSGHSNFQREKIFSVTSWEARLLGTNQSTQFENQPIRKLAFISYESYVQKLG